MKIDYAARQQTLQQRLRDLVAVCAETQALLQQYQQEIHEIHGRLKELQELERTENGDRRMKGSPAS